jgi:competence protein ComEC
VEIAASPAERHARTTAIALPSKVAGFFLAERERWALWLPVGLGVGIVVYFALPLEPDLGWVAAPFAVAAFAVAMRRWGGTMPVGATAALVIAGVVATGFALTQVRAAIVAAPVIGQRIGPTTVTGRIRFVEAMADDRRVTLDEVSIRDLAADRTPGRVRLRLRGDQPALTAGQWIRVRAIVMPPPAPVAPGAFDFQREAYFAGLGAIGFSLGAPAVVAGKASWEDRWLTALARLRQSLTARIQAALPGATGAVAAAQMTGERSAIPEPVMAAIRDSGLAHLLAISGLNIGLAAGILFVSVRGLLALIPPVALRYPVKKWAAAVAVLGAAAYTLVSGATVPTQRAFLMVTIVLMAVLVDRRGLSMRTLAWAATVILLVTPEVVLTASFQLSFAAVIALIAFYEQVSLVRLPGGEAPSWWRRGLVFLAGVAATTVIAGAATTPIALYHFNRFAAYGLAANLLAVPVTTLWVMPWAVLSFLLMPLGLEHLALTPMGWGVDLVISVAIEVASWPGAVSLLPGIPVWGLAAAACGGLWLCLWRGRWRLWGLLGFVVGLTSVPTTSPPDVLVDGEGKLMAVRDADGGLMVSSLRTGRFTRRAWLQDDGLTDVTATWPKEGVSADGRLACDGVGCIYRAAGRTVAVVRRGDALAEDCRIADVVVALLPVRRGCRSPAAVIDWFDLWREGGHAVWLGGETVRVSSVNGQRGHRPWVVRRTARGGDPAADD